MAGEILFIDDDEWFARRYVEELRKHGYVVYECTRASDVEGYLHEYPEIAGIVLDIMMPTPPGVPPTLTNDGLNTGLWLLERIKDYVVSGPRPVLIVTNRNPAIVTDRLSQLQFPAELVEIRRKMDTPAFYLPVCLERFLRDAKLRWEQSRSEGQLEL